MSEHTEQEASKYKRSLQKLVVLTFLCLMFGYSLSSCTSQVQERKDNRSPYQPLPENLVAADTMEGVDFSRFKHDSERHFTVPCLLCHQRNEDSPKPKFSGHSPCIGCHTPQFQDSSHPICVICHTEPNSDKLKPFPPMKSFKANFNHAQHFKETNCATCHKPEGGGGMNVPARSEAHVACFQCHKSDAVAGDRNIGSCSTCHEFGQPNRIVDRVENIGFNFDHAKHGGLNCNSCHNPLRGNEMSAITVAMHSRQANSCATCHNEKRAFGANDFSDCRRCHQEVAGTQSFGIKFSHAVHTKSDCATCHKTGKNGVNFTVPNSENAHRTCFQCHSPTKDTGNFTSSKCFSCHQPGNWNNISPPPQIVKGNFSHTKHSFFECSNCHTQTGGNMGAPKVAMHGGGAKSVTSCATCHDNQTAFGEEFANCKRCHTGENFK